jgi:hypothetical protein
VPGFAGHFLDGGEDLERVSGCRDDETLADQWEERPGEQGPLFAGIEKQAQAQMP